MKVLLLHALPFDGSMWNPTIERLARTTSLEFVAPDLFELGDSIEEWAHGALELVGSSGAGGGSGGLIVVGNSVGGSCALEVAAAAPERVRALVLVGAKAGVNPDSALRDEAIRLLETEGLEPAWERYWRPLFAASTPTAVVDAARSIALNQRVDAIVNAVRAFHDRRDLSEFATRWSGPLVGVSGEHDSAPPPAVLRALATGNDRTFRLVADCGHYVSLEQPDHFDTILDGVIRAIDRGQRS